jgi:hypothetical protein
MKTLKVKGREYKLDADDQVAEAQKAVEEQTAAVDSMGAKLAAAEEALKGAIGEIAALKAKIAAEEKAETVVTEDMVPDEVADSIATKREALRADARAVLGADAKLDGLPRRKVHEQVIAKVLPSVKLDGLSDAHVEGMFTAAVTGAKTSTRADSLRAAHPGVPEARTDADDDGNLDPRAALNARTHNRFDTRGKDA